MFVIQNNNFSIYFGDAQDNLIQKDCLALSGISSKDLVNHPFFKSLQSVFDDQFTSLIFLHQVHGIDGSHVNDTNQLINPFGIDGDFLTTNQLGVGIGVLTADCVPIVLYDPAQRAVAIAHAGWRGTVAGIAVAALERMQAQYRTNRRDVKIYFGPSAQSCCYEVQDSFIKDHLRSDLARSTVTERDAKFYFDTVGYNKQLLKEVGVDENAFDCSSVRCTICDDRFCSHRRQGTTGRRQMTVVVLQ
jgi:YfiH family protein